MSDAGLREVLLANLRMDAMVVMSQINDLDRALATAIAARQATSLAPLLDRLAAAEGRVLRAEEDANRAIDRRREEMARREAAEAKVARVEAEHFEDTDGFCHGCGYGWPCATKAALGAAGHGETPGARSGLTGRSGQPGGGSGVGEGDATASNDGGATR